MCLSHTFLFLRGLFSTVAPAMISIRVEGGADTQVPSRPVQFQLSQTQGSKAETTYEYSFGDGHTMAFYGFSNAASVSHAYAGPGIFVVSVVASNVAGRSSNSTTVTVRGELARPVTRVIYVSMISMYNA